MNTLYDKNRRRRTEASPVYYKIYLMMSVLIRVASIWQSILFATLSTYIMIWYLIGNSFPSIVLPIYNI